MVTTGVCVLEVRGRKWQQLMQRSVDRCLRDVILSFGAILPGGCPYVSLWTPTAILEAISPSTHRDLGRGYIWFASRAFQLHTFDRINTASTYLYVSFAAAVAADSTVAISLCALLFHSRTGIKRTDSIVRILMAFSINTGLLTSICALACLITYAIWPKNFIFIGFYFVLSKLYVNSLLASLNARSSLIEKDTSYSTDRETASASERTTGMDIRPTTLHLTMQDRSLGSTYGTATKDAVGPTELYTENVNYVHHQGDEQDHDPRRRRNDLIMDAAGTPV
ncbi:hypothetical protein D9619_008607 [Psilocybe cf. subviscida]|uniref:DUF6534 domain-containing protein n=1 Tax=Psilocybe cf. subviscida TaxID=2480587 RepID=A0A8H5BC50_9AGAR|nr:hypothetical protein D9619_008607 [Psilocybe cf. subviscida]